MSDVDQQLLREVRDDQKALRHDVSTLIATVGAHIERAQHDTHLLKRTMFGDGDRPGMVVRMDRLERAYATMAEDHKTARSDRRKAIGAFVSAIISAVVGWIVVAIQAFPGHKP